MRTRTVTLPAPDGPLEVCLAEAGAGGRPLVLVHGFTGAKEDFTPWLDALAGLGWHAVAPDQRGHGASAKPDDPGAYSFDVFAADLLALFEVLGWGSAVALGHSMGGMVVQTAVLQAPERFEGLVLMDTSHRPVRGVDPEVVALAGAIALEQGMPGLLAAQAAVAGPPAPAHQRLLDTREGYAEFMDRKLLESSPAMYAAMLRAVTGTGTTVDRLDGLRSVTAPALVMVGEQDRPFLKASARMAEALPRGDLVVIADAAHSPQFEAEQAWWQALTGFLGAL